MPNLTVQRLIYRNLVKRPRINWALNQVGKALNKAGFSYATGLTRNKAILYVSDDPVEISNAKKALHSSSRDRARYAIEESTEDALKVNLTPEPNISQNFRRVVDQLESVYKEIQRKAEIIEAEGKLSAKEGVEELMSAYEHRLIDLYNECWAIMVREGLTLDSIIEITIEFLKNSNKARLAGIKPQQAQVFLQNFGLPESVKKLREELLAEAPPQIRRYLAHRNYMQARLHKFIMQIPFCRRIFEKPLGYAGDFLMLQGIYDNALEGDNLYQKFVHHFTVNRQMAKSVRGRTPFLKSKIKEGYSALMQDNSQGWFTFASIACGSAVEVIELVEEKAIPRSKASLVDMEKLAWRSIVRSLGYDYEEEVDKLVNVDSQEINLRFFKRSVFDFYKGFVLDGDHNLIYSTGLFDYLREEHASFLISKLFSCLAPGGVLIIGNFKSREESARAYMEFLLEWALIYRDEDDLRKLAKEVREQGEITIERDLLGIQLYLVIKKRDS